MQSEFTYELNKFGFMQKRLKREYKTLVQPCDSSNPQVMADILNPKTGYRYSYFLITLVTRLKICMLGLTVRCLKDLLRLYRLKSLLLTSLA